MAVILAREPLQLLAVPLNATLDAKRLDQETVAANHVSAGESVQLVTSDSGVAAGTRRTACCGGVPALADDVLGEGVAARLMSVVATVAFVVPLNRGNVFGDRGWGGNGSSSSLNREALESGGLCLSFPRHRPSCTQGER